MTHIYVENVNNLFLKLYLVAMDSSQSVSLHLWSILIQWIRVVMTIWPSECKRKHTSCLWNTLLHEQKERTEKKGDWSLAELCVHKAKWRLIKYNEETEHNVHSITSKLELTIPIQVSEKPECRRKR